MVQMVRAHAEKLERPLRGKLLELYQPFLWTPCFLHNVFEGFIKYGKKLPVIIEFEKGCYEAGRDEVKKVMNNHFFNGVKRDFSRVACCSADVTPKGLEEMLASCNYIRRVYLNREVRPLLDVAVPSANAKEIVRDNKVLTGKGVTIAVVDTGIYPHQDLSGRIVGFIDFIKNKTDPYDDNGHGTHCAGDAAGNGTASSFKYRGPAPEANLIGVKVLNKMGSGSWETIMDGIEWCIQYNENNPANKIEIISMSVGSAAQFYEKENDDPMVKIVEEAWASGIVVFVAAGNEGPESGTIASPGISNQVITVGALDDRDTAETRSDDDVAGFSSRGPTIYGKPKPDILAPGVSIVSLRSPKSYLDKHQKANRVKNDYFVLSGTSMATPICAGVAALIKQHRPDLSPEEVKDLLMKGADLWTDRNHNIYGAGYINANNSIPSD